MLSSYHIIWLIIFILGINNVGSNPASLNYLFSLIGKTLLFHSKIVSSNLIVNKVINPFGGSR